DSRALPLPGTARGSGGPRACGVPAGARAGRDGRVAPDLGPGAAPGGAEERAAARRVTAYGSCTSARAVSRRASARMYPAPPAPRSLPVMNHASRGTATAFLLCLLTLSACSADADSETVTTTEQPDTTLQADANAVTEE